MRRGAPRPPAAPGAGPSGARPSQQRSASARSAVCWSSRSSSKG